MRTRVVLSLSALLSASLLLSGCGKKTLAKMAVAPVSGKVLINGKPTARVELTFYPLQPPAPGFSEIHPVAVSDAQGEFHPSTYNSHDGLPPGEYAVTLRWPTITEDHGEEVIGADRLAGRFSTPEKPAARVVIREEANELPPIDVKHP